MFTAYSWGRSVDSRRVHPRTRMKYLTNGLTKGGRLFGLLFVERKVVQYVVFPHIGGEDDDRFGQVLTNVLK